MKRKPKLRFFEESAISGVNIVPVIDLCLVLLVILLILSPLMDSANLDVKLPNAQTKEEKEDNVSITIAPDGRMALNSDLIEPKELPRLLKVALLEHGQDVLVVIRSDKNVRYGTLTELLKTVKESGARKISLGTESPKPGAEGANPS